MNIYQFGLFTFTYSNLRDALLLKCPTFVYVMENDINVSLILKVISICIMSTKQINDTH